MRILKIIIFIYLAVVLDVSAEVVLKNDSVRKLAELEGLESLDLSGDSITYTGQYQVKSIVQVSCLSLLVPID